MTRWKKSQGVAAKEKGITPYENAIMALLLALVKERKAKRPRIALSDTPAAHSAATGLMKMRLVSVIRQEKTGRMYCIWFKDYKHYTNKGFQIARVNRRGEWLFSARLRDPEGLKLEKDLYVPKVLYSSL